MKKFMIVAFAVAFAAVAQAASIQWSIAARSWSLQNGSNAAQGTNVYLIDSAYTQTIIGAIASDGSINAATTGILDIKPTENARGAITIKTVNNTSLVADQSYDFAILLIDTTSENGTYYMVSKSITQAAYDAGAETPTPTSANFGTANFGSNAAIGWTKVETGAIPEPTSALMLLVGLAGLALKRKVA